MSKATELMPEPGTKVEGLVKSLHVGSEGQFDAVTLLVTDEDDVTVQHEQRVEFDDDDLIREATEMLEDFLSRGKLSGEEMEGLTILHDEPGAARIGDLDPEDSANTAWVVVFRRTGPAPEIVEALRAKASGEDPLV